MKALIILVAAAALVFAAGAGAARLAVINGTPGRTGSTGRRRPT
jgi:hypothetical protein